MTMTRWLQAATAVIALHVVDDNYLQPERGTSPGDHLASGLIPIALLFAAIYVYPRARAGVVAVVAASAGFLGVVMGGSEAGIHTFRGGFVGDDVSGWLAAVAGVGLL